MARSGLPVIVPVTEFRDTLGTAITNIVAGGRSGRRTEEGDGGVPAGARQVERGVATPGAGMLVLVVGPSGAGKDTLLEAARQALADDARFRFVRRVITRPAEAGGEAHEAVTETEFAARDFALQWQAHGLRYGIPADAVEDGMIAVANVSRMVIAEAARRFPIRVIEVTAPPEILAVAAGVAQTREQRGDVAQRLARSVALPDHVPVDTVVNDGVAGRRRDALRRRAQPRSGRRSRMTNGAPGAG